MKVKKSEKVDKHMKLSREWKQETVEDEKDWETKCSRPDWFGQEARKKLEQLGINVRIETIPIKAISAKYSEESWISEETHCPSKETRHFGVKIPND